MAASLPFLSSLFFLLLGCSRGTIVELVPRNCSEETNSTTLNSIISEGRVTNDTFYRLLSGIHCLSEFAYVENLHNLTFSGGGGGSGGDDGGGGESVFITCTKGIGLVFLDIRELVLESLIISDCGTSGQGRFDRFEDKLKNRTEYFYDIHSADTIALAAGLVADFTLRNINVSSTEGLGLLVVNPLGPTVVDSSIFLSNYPPFCYRLPIDNITEDNNQIGGGAYFVFTDFINSSDNVDTTLDISNTEFIENSYCGISSHIAVSYTAGDWMRDNLGYFLGGGGGLSLILSQSHYTVEVTVTSNLFRNNTGLIGGGVFLALFEGTGGNNVSFTNCQFLRNGFRGDFIDNVKFPSRGSGFFMVLDLAYPSDSNTRIERSLNSQINQVILEGTTLEGNRGSYSAAVNILSQYRSMVLDSIVLQNCTLSHNEAIVGAAMYIGESKQSGLQPGMNVILRDITITHNRIYSEDSAGNLPSTSKSETSAAVEFQAVSISFRGENNVIADNSAAAFRSVSSVLYFHDQTTICNNSGSFGGGISLIASSYLVMKNNSYLIFENNSAIVEGGAIYVNLLAYSPDINYHDCFLFFEEVSTICLGNDSCPSLETLNFTLELNSNRAPLGSIIFGSTLDTCPWSQDLREAFNKQHVLSVMYEYLSDWFIFSSDPASITEVTTTTDTLAIHGVKNITSSPGEQFFLNVSGYDHLSQRIPVLISSKPLLTNNITSFLGDSAFSYLSNSSERDQVPVILSGAVNTPDIAVYLYATDSYSHTKFYVNLTGCQVGFSYDSDSGKCLCEDGLQDHSGIACDPVTMELNVSNNKWVGPAPHSNHSLLIANCISDFCSPGERVVKSSNLDSLCYYRYYRSGILCGRCAEGYSVTLGSHACHDCRNNNGLSLLLLFAFGGVIIIFGILFLHITVSEGYINSVIFYSNILTVYVPVFSSYGHSVTVFVLVSWLNLNFGIDQCFYDGMTTLHHVGLSLVFPFYLLLLLLLVTFISKKSRRLSVFFSQSKFSAAKMFATVLLISYATILEVCLELISPVSIHSVDGKSTYLRWRSDPNVVYFQRHHRYLAILAFLLILVILIPPPILLMFPRIAFSTRLGVWFKPVLDAFWAPFKTKFRFFVGFRLLLRIIPYTMAYMTQNPVNVLSLGIFSICLLFLQVIIQPFDGFFRNTLDSFFLSNIIALVMGTLYFQISITAHEENKEYVTYHKAQLIYFTFFLMLAYGAILMVIVWHIHHRFPVITKRFLSLVSKLRRKERFDVQLNETTPLTQSLTDSDSDDSRGTINERESERAKVPVVVNYSVLREPLLEEGEADLVTVTDPKQIH